jgi:hypothetical protein
VAGITVDLRRENGQTLPADDADGRAVDERGEVAELEPFLDRLIGAVERAGTYGDGDAQPDLDREVEVEEGRCRRPVARGGLAPGLIRGTYWASNPP